jgi:hypothetical protein
MKVPWMPNLLLAAPLENKQVAGFMQKYLLLPFLVEELEKHKGKLDLVGKMCCSPKS